MHRLPWRLNQIPFYLDSPFLYSNQSPPVKSTTSTNRTFDSMPPVGQRLRRHKHSRQATTSAARRPAGSHREQHESDSPRVRGGSNSDGLRARQATALAARVCKVTAASTACMARQSGCCCGTIPPPRGYAARIRIHVSISNGYGYTNTFRHSFKYK